MSEYKSFSAIAMGMAKQIAPAQTEKCWLWILDTYKGDALLQMDGDADAIKAIEYMYSKLVLQKEYYEMRDLDM